MSFLEDSNEVRGKYASLSLYRGDRIQLLGFPSATYRVIRDVVKTCWSGRIQHEWDRKGLKVIKLRGYPWNGIVPDPTPYDPAAPIWMMSRVFEQLFNAGWLLIQRTCLGWALEDIETFLFRGVDSPRPREWMAIDISLGWCMLVRAPDDIIQAVSDLFPAQRKSARATYCCSLPSFPGDIKDKSTSIGIKCPFWILRAIEAHGWSLYAAVKQRGVDSWHFCRERAADENENPFDTTSENIILDDGESSDLAIPQSVV